MPAAEQDTATMPTDHQAAAAAVTEEIFPKTKEDSKHFKMKCLLSLFILLNPVYYSGSPFFYNDFPAIS
jgi:hypothetical protein